MALDHPVTLDVARPVTFDRAQVLLRVVILLLLAWVGMPFGWLFFLIYLGLPAFAAIVVAQRGGASYLAGVAPRLVSVLETVLAWAAYLSLVTDRPPSAADRGVRLAVAPGGQPTTGGALVRILTAIPYALLLWLVSVVAMVVWLIAAIAVLVSRTYPASLHGFLTGYLRWYARLFAYLGAVVEAYPSISFDTRPAEPLAVT